MTTYSQESEQPALSENRNLVFGILLSVYGVVILRTAWVGEDAYITFRTIANFFAHQGLSFNPGERVQAFTHPLWLFFTAAAYYIHRDFFVTVIVLSAILALTAAVILATRVALSTASAILGVSILILSRAFIDYSTSGLENPLSYLLVVIFLLIYFSQAQSIRRLFLLTFVAALGTLNRPDAILFFLPGLIHAFWTVRSRKAVLAVILGFLPMIVWELFSVFYYGFPFPNTAYAKLNTGISASELAQQGLYYLFSSMNQDPLTIISIVSGVVIAIIDRNLRHILVASGIVLYLAYLVMIGGDFMAGRFLTIPLLAAVAIIVNRRLSSSPGFFAVLGFVILLGFTSPYPTLLSGADYGKGRQDSYDRWGIADERAIYYQGAGLLSANRYISLPNNDYVNEGLAVKDSGEKVHFTSHIGYLGFYASRNVHIVDTLGLGDALLARLTPQTKPYWIMAQFTRFVPEGYKETIESGQNMITDPDLAAYYDKLSLVIKGKLTDPRRLVEIWKLNFGYYNHLIASYEDNLLLHINLSEVNNPNGSKAPRDDSGRIIFPMYGIKISLGGLEHTQRVNITLSARSTYRIIFYKAGNIIARQLWEGDYSQGLQPLVVRISSQAAKTGFDSITILPGNPTDSYLLGGIELLK